MASSTLIALTLATTAAQGGTAGQVSQRQETFNSATALAEKGECAEAVKAFDAWIADPAYKPGTLSAAAVDVRRGLCLINLGREGEAELAIRAGLPRLRAGGPSFTLESGRAVMALASLAMRRLDYEEATRIVKASLPTMTGEMRETALISLAKSSVFDDGSEPLAYADEALALAEADATTPKNYLAAIHTIRARILMNQERASEAFSALQTALRLQGGLTQKTSVDEAITRGDLALAALMVGRKDRAREYLAYTGAGRIAESPFMVASDMTPPVCGTGPGLTPNDRAVVQFNLLADGSVGGVVPIYATGGRDTALAFAAAVRDWSWAPDSIAKIPAFYRMATRVELRCTTSGEGQPGILFPLKARYEQWRDAEPGTADFFSKAEARSLPGVRAALSAAEAANDVKRQVMALTWLSEAQVVAIEERRTANARALALAQEQALPAAVVNWLRIGQAQLAADPQAASKGRTNPALRALLTDAKIADDALAINAVRLLLASSVPSRTEQGSAESWLAEVTADTRLGSGHPLHNLALLQLANRASARGERAEANAYFAATGLTEQQCALLGTPPVLRKTGAGSDDFPREALLMGFEGWVRMEYDINADGGTATPRAVIAYPPFVFADAATGMTRDIKYDVSFRPSGGKACSAYQTNIRFALPHLRN